MKQDWNKTQPVANAKGGWVTAQNSIKKLFVLYSSNSQFYGQKVTLKRDKK
jgi:hypothetical protein